MERITLTTKPSQGYALLDSGNEEKLERYGDVILSRRPESWRDFFELMKTVEVPKDFLADRKDAPPQKRRLF